VNNGANNANAPLANDEQWHFVAQTFDGTTIRLYLDGSLVASTASTATSTGSNSEFSFGGRSILTNTFVGQIDEAFFRDDVLSDSQIAQLAVVPEPSTLVLALWAAVALVSFRRHRSR